MNIPSLNPEEFLKQSAHCPVLDVRSPKEFAEGHIPGAISFPLFTDEERAVVGTLYKQEGREKAIDKGLEIVGSKMAGFVQQARAISNGKPLLVHCWRGGMRSGSMAWLLQTAGLNVSTLKGGYKAYRGFITEAVNQPRKYVVIGGMTGSGKTTLLYELKKIGEQVIDLEAMAHHKGSAFGSIGEQPQPTTEQFLNDLYEALSKLDTEKVIWLEDESRNIGSVQLPETFYRNYRQAPLVIYNVPMEARLNNLVADYVLADKEILKTCFNKIERKLGGQHLKAALQALDENDYHKAAAVALFYYDKAYKLGLDTKDTTQCFNLDAVSDNATENAIAVKKLCYQQIVQLWKTTV
jgi:tRNA 2-selenouridine synthase